MHKLKEIQEKLKKLQSQETINAVVETLKETIGHCLDGRALCRIECFRTDPLNLTSLFDSRSLLIDLIPIGLHSWGC